MIMNTKKNTRLKCSAPSSPFIDTIKSVQDKLQLDNVVGQAYVVTHKDILSFITVITKTVSVRYIPYMKSLKFQDIKNCFSICCGL